MMRNVTKVLIVCSGNSNYIAPFILEQVNEIKKLGISTEYFLIKGKGLFGYLSNLDSLVRKIKHYSPDLVHAHYGLSGLLATLQHIKPVVITLHGSDINYFIPRLFSKIALQRVSPNRVIFVSEKMSDKININNPINIPCGVNLEIFYPKDKKQSIEIMQLNPSKKYILFSSRFDNKVKNAALAFKVIDYLRKYYNNIELIELCKYTRKEVGIIMNAVDVALLTSFHEGSPQFIKEAMACNCPIVTTDVGDVRWVIGDTKGCYICSFKTEDIAEKIMKVFKFNRRTNGRQRIVELELDSIIVGQRIAELYNKILNNIKLKRN